MTYTAIIKDGVVVVTEWEPNNEVVLLVPVETYLKRKHEAYVAKLSAQPHIPVHPVHQEWFSKRLYQKLEEGKDFVWDYETSGGFIHYPNPLHRKTK